MTLPDGSTHTLHFKEVSVVHWRAFHLAEAQGDPEKKAAAIADLIAASLCTAEGDVAIEKSEARALTTSAAGALFACVVDVNKLKAGDSGKESKPEPKNGSGT